MKIAVLPGDGIGPEVVKQAVRAIKALEAHNVHFEFEEGAIGAGAYAATGEILPPKTLDIAQRADAMLFGSVCGYKEDAFPRGKRPSDALLYLRKEFGFYANYRPAILFPELIGASTLRPEFVKGLDIMILRELVGGLYFGEPRYISKNASGVRVGVNTMTYT